MYKCWTLILDGSVCTGTASARCHSSRPERKTPGADRAAPPTPNALPTRQSSSHFSRSFYSPPPRPPPATRTNEGSCTRNKRRLDEHAPQRRRRRRRRRLSPRCVFIAPDGATSCGYLKIVRERKSGPNRKPLAESRPGHGATRGKS